MSLTAVKTETYVWSTYSNLIDVIFKRDDKQLPGSMTLHLDNFEKTFQSELDRLRTGYGVYDAGLDKVVFGPWFDPINEDEIKQAVQSALA